MNVICIVPKKKTVEIAQLWQHNRGNYTTPTIYQKKNPPNFPHPPSFDDATFVYTTALECINNK